LAFQLESDPLFFENALFSFSDQLWITVISCRLTDIRDIESYKTKVLLYLLHVNEAEVLLK